MVLLLLLSLATGCVKKGADAGDRVDRYERPILAEPPTDWIDQPVADNCPACAPILQRIHDIQQKAAKLHDLMQNTDPNNPYYNEDRHSMWQLKADYHQARADLVECHHKNCPDQPYDQPSTPAENAQQLSEAQAMAASHPASAPASQSTETASAAPYLPSPNPWRIGLNAGYDYYNIPKVGFGTKIGGGEERFLLEGPSHLNGSRFGVGIEYANLDNLLGYTKSTDLFGPYNSHGLFGAFDYGHATGSSDAFIPRNTDAIAFTNNTIHGPGGTGVAAGTTGAEGDVHLQLDSFDVRFGNYCDRPFTRDGNLRIYAGPMFQFQDWDYQANLQSLTFNDLRARYDQQVDAWRAGLSIDAKLTYSLDRHWQVFGGVGGDVSYYNYHLDSDQHIIAGAANLNYHLPQTDTNDGATLGLHTALGVRYAQDNWSAGLSGGFNYLLDAPYINNAENPSDVPGYMDTSDAWSLGLRAHYSLRF